MDVVRLTSFPPQQILGFGYEAYSRFHEPKFLS